MTRLKLAGIKQHHPASDGREIMLQLEVVKNRTFGNNIFQESSQVGDIPLAVAQLVNQAVFSFFERDFKGLIEGPVARSHAQGRVENQEWFAHRIDDVLGV